MGVRESWNELGTGGKVAVGLVVGGIVLVVGLVLLVVLAAILGSFVLGMGSSAGGAPPAMTPAFDYTASNETLRVTHAGGDAVDADDLLIETDGRTVGWTAEDGTVTAGASTTAEAAPGSTVRLIWTGGDGRQVLGTHDVEE